jgi:hypothetical protein
MSTAPYIPPTNSGFSAWLINFSTLLTAAPTTYGCTTGQATATASQNTAYQAAYTLATDPTTRTSPTVADAQAARATALAVVRPIAVSIAANPAVTNLNKVAIGVTVRKTTPTPVPPPTTTPTLSVVGSVSLQLTLAYRDTTTPTSKAKPPGAIGIQLFVNVGTVPATDPSQCLYYGTWTKSPNNYVYASGSIGKFATFFAQWVTRSGPGGVAQVGPYGAALVVNLM